MPWLQLRIDCSRNNANKIEFAIQKSGALSVTLQDNADQPIFEPELGETPLWQETRVTGLFNADIDSDTTLSLVEKKLGEPLPNHHWHILEDKDWEREWMTHYQPIQCHDDFWICPSWCEPPDSRATNLKLDPGLAFGTGTHPTTFLCLQWLAKQNLNDATVVDYGCGSGILGIAALLRGANHVTGVDIDPQALLATRDNIQRNNLDGNRFLAFYPPKCPETKVDVVFANILAGPLVELALTLANLTLPGGKICLSGIINTQKTKILDAYTPHFDIEAVTENEEWICVTGSRKPK